MAFPHSHVVSSASLASAVVALTLTASNTWAQGAPTDYLVQEVCVDSSNIALQADPITCPGSRRKLRVGEPLPYHKIDLRGVQISDSWPVFDANNQTISVQSKFFVDGYNLDPRFPNMVYAHHGRTGYDILGADSSTVFARGTYDPGGGWQPWFTQDCQAKGWAFYPNDTSAFSTTALQSTDQTDTRPQCPAGWTLTPNVYKWRKLSYAFATGKTLETIKSEHFSPNGDAIEIFFNTREYGPTRWEAWRENGPPPSDFVKSQCPGIAYEFVSLDGPGAGGGRVYALQDCRDWSTITYPAQPWSPLARSPVDPQAVVWPVDPIYTGSNILPHTRFGKTIQDGPTDTCQLNGWDRILDRAYTLNWGWDSRVNLAANPYPMTAKWNCVLQFSTPGPSDGQGLQSSAQIPAMSGAMSFGGTFWAPNWTPGQTQPQILVRIFQSSHTGIIGSTNMTIDVTDLPATFAGTFSVMPEARYLTMSIYPMTPHAIYSKTGTWITRLP